MSLMYKQILLYSLLDKWKKILKISKKIKIMASSKLNSYCSQEYIKYYSGGSMVKSVSGYSIVISCASFLSDKHIEALVRHELGHIYYNSFSFADYINDCMGIKYTESYHKFLNLLEDGLINKDIPIMKETNILFVENSLKLAGISKKIGELDAYSEEYALTMWKLLNRNTKEECANSVNTTVEYIDSLLDEYYKYRSSKDDEKAKEVFIKLYELFHQNDDENEGDNENERDNENEGDNDRENKDDIDELIKKTIKKMLEEMSEDMEEKDISSSSTLDYDKVDKVVKQCISVLSRIRVVSEDEIRKDDYSGKRLNRSWMFAPENLKFLKKPFKKTITTTSINKPKDIVILVDGSGSMDGEPELYSKAFAIALMYCFDNVVIIFKNSLNEKIYNKNNFDPYEFISIPDNYSEGFCELSDEAINYIKKAKMMFVFTDAQIDEEDAIALSKYRDKTIGVYCNSSLGMYDKDIMETISKFQCVDENGDMMNILKRIYKLMERVINK